METIMKTGTVLGSALPAIAALMLTTAAYAQTTTPPGDGVAPPSPPAQESPGMTEPTAPGMTAPEAAPTPSPSVTGDAASAPIISDEQAKTLKNAAVWSSDQKNVGEVADIKRDSSGRVTELYADIGGFLGFGETRVRVMPDEFKVETDRIVLTRTAAQVEALPKASAY